MPVKRLHIYYCVDDRVIEAHKTHIFINHEDNGQAACFQSTADTDCDSYHANVNKRETDLNPYHTLKDNRDAKTHEYVDIPKPAGDQCTSLLYLSCFFLS